MTTPLSSDAASKILADAFQPLGCVISPCAETQGLGFGILGTQGQPLLDEQLLAPDDYRDPTRLQRRIEAVRQELSTHGEKLDAWQMPFITDPDALPPLVVN